LRPLHSRATIKNPAIFVFVRMILQHLFCQNLGNIVSLKQNTKFQQKALQVCIKFLTITV
jgi:hypothetical protein